MARKSITDRFLDGVEWFTEKKFSMRGERIRTAVVPDPNSTKGEKTLAGVLTSRAARFGLGWLAVFTIGLGTDQDNDRPVDGSAQDVGKAIGRESFNGGYEIVKFGWNIASIGVGFADAACEATTICNDAADKAGEVRDVFTGDQGPVTTTTEGLIIDPNQIIIGGQENGAAPTTTTEALGAPDANAAVIIGNIACAGPSMDISMEGFGSPSQAILSASPAMEGHPDRYDIVDYAMNLPVNTGLVPEAMRQEDVIKGVPTNCASQ